MIRNLSSYGLILTESGVEQVSLQDPRVCTLTLASSSIPTAIRHHYNPSMRTPPRRVMNGLLPGSLCRWKNTPEDRIIRIAAQT